MGAGVRSARAEGLRPVDVAAWRLLLEDRDGYGMVGLDGGRH